MEYYKDNHITIYNKDCRNMSELAGNSVQCVVTSPPYWGLRKYAGEQDLIWGGKEDCQHQWQHDIAKAKSGTPSSKSTLRDGDGINANEPKMRGLSDNAFFSAFCLSCGAWKGQLGLEPSPELYIAHLVEIFREVRRVLRKDGMVFLNIGDSYAGSNSGKGDYREKKGLQKDIYDWEHPQASADKWDKWRRGIGGEKYGTSLSGIPRPLNLKPKDLCLIPFRVAIAAQEDGWWVRSVIIWNKLNPMPESVKDRPTESHEYILMLTKSARYYWDQEAVREGSVDSESFSGRRWRSYSRSDYSNGAFISNIEKQNPTKDVGAIYLKRNLRSVWTFPTQGYPEAHFATFPEELPERCIKASSKEGDTILDPFAGSGTTLWVAKKLNRKAIGYELSSEYCELIIERNRQQGLI